MTGRPIWFAPRRYGFGTGWPIAWQGWALVAMLVALLGLAWALFGDNDVRALAIIVPALIGFTIAAALTTKGGWRWRWGEKE